MIAVTAIYVVIAFGVLVFEYSRAAKGERGTGVYGDGLSIDYFGCWLTAFLWPLVVMVAAVVGPFILLHETLKRLTE